MDITHLNVRMYENLCVLGPPLFMRHILEWFPSSGCHVKHTQDLPARAGRLDVYVAGDMEVIWK
jgi:hypothetical protein